MKMLLLVLFFAPVVFAQEKIKIEDLKSFVLNKNPLVKAQNHSLKAADYRAGGVARTFLPEVKLYAYDEQYKEGSASWDKGPGYGAEAKVNLFNSFKDNFAAKSNNYLFESEKLKAKDFIQSELIEVSVLYWEIVFLERKLVFHELELLQNEKNKSSAQKRINAGIASQTDRFEFEMFERSLKQEILNEMEEVAYLKRRLFQRLNVSEEAELISKIEEDLHLPKKPVVKFKSYVAKSSEMEFLAAESRHQQKSIWWAPQVDFYASFDQFNRREKDFASSSDRNEYIFGLRLELPLLDKGQSFSEGRALASEAQQLALKAKFSQEAWEAEYDFLSKKLAALHQALKLSQENEEMGTKYVESVRSEYGRGVKNSMDMMAATQKVFALKMEHLSNQKEFQILKYKLAVLSESAE